MIKPQELRLGNYIKDGNDIEQVSSRHLQMLIEGQAEFDAVPLTEEWLLKFRFDVRYYNEDETKPIYWKEVKNRFIDIYPHKEHNYYFLINSIQMSVPLKFVHQLQNLFYSLTGEELTIKETP